MLISTGKVVASLAFYQSINKREFSIKTKLPINFKSTSSALFASDESHGEGNIHFLTNDRDYNDVTSSINLFSSRAHDQCKSWANNGRFIAMCLGRSRRGIPRTTNISQHAINSLARLGRECCLTSAFLLMFHQISTPSQPLCRFITTNLTRWVAVSFVIKLLNLQSKITASNQSTTNIDDDWFLKGKYYVKSLGTIKKIRQVPSDGSCLFHAIGASLLHEEMKQRQEMEETDFTQGHPSMSRIVEYSQMLRERAVNALERDPERTFVINQDEEPTAASSLVDLAAQQYEITAEEYLTSMREESVWGGGPEIIALASELKRQIVVLEPTNEDVCNDVHTLQIRAKFGEAVSCDDDGTAIYILCADQNYPDDSGGKGGGNHFFAVFPSTF